MVQKQEQNSKKQPKPPVKRDSHAIFLFARENYLIMFLGLGIIIVGFLLMVGGGSSDPNQFHPDQVYSWRRITLAPIVVLIGLLVEIYAIMKKPKAQ